MRGLEDTNNRIGEMNKHDYSFTCMTCTHLYDYSVSFVLVRTGVQVYYRYCTLILKQKKGRYFEKFMETSCNVFEMLWDTCLFDTKFSISETKSVLDGKCTRPFIHLYDIFSVKTPKCHDVVSENIQIPPPSPLPMKGFLSSTPLEIPI